MDPFHVRHHADTLGYLVIERTQMSIISRSKERLGRFSFDLDETRRLT